MKYVIMTTSTAISKYIVEASTKEEAVQKFWDVDVLDDEVVDYQDENITSVSEGK